MQGFSYLFSTGSGVCLWNWNFYVVNREIFENFYNKQNNNNNLLTAGTLL